MTDAHIAVGMLLILILTIFLGFPVAFTLMALGVGFGYYAYYDAGRMSDAEVVKAYLGGTPV